MKHVKFATMAATVLALAACSEEVPEEGPVEEVASSIDLVDDEIIDPNSVTLDEEQQGRLDAMDASEVEREFTTNRDTMQRDMDAAAENSGAMASSDDSASRASSGQMASSDNDSDMANDASSSSSASANSGTSSANANDGANAMAGSSGMTTMPPRSQMTYSFLDRNGDGKLSVAEYAIWAVDANPTKPKANDSTRPYITPQQINDAGKTFFYFDEDGSTYLSEQEFMTARNSSRTP